MPDRKEPRPLKYVWVRWEPVIYQKTKWHKFLARNALLYGWRYSGTTCSQRIAHDLHDVEVTADTPHKDKCCKKCWEKVHE